MKCRNCKHLGWGEECPGEKFYGWCKEVCDAPELDKERECRYFEPATNADIIRRMSDEELAKFLEYEGGGACAECCGWLDWLRRPAEEET